MATGSRHTLTRLIHGVRTAAPECEPASISDGELLEAFLDRRDETAFASLVKRHGGMVLGVCQRVIGHRHDAEDAFQAVFLVLARKAGSIAPRDLVGNWLHGVAYRTALQARSRLGRHRARERQVKAMPQATATAELELQELHQVLDRELQALSEKYRVPIVLCELEGRPRREVARQLKIPEGTLSSRLAKGRALLAKRLARHDVALTAGVLTSVLAAQAASAAPAPALVASTAQAAALAIAGQSAVGVVSANVIALSQGVIKTMFLDKLKMLSVLVLGFLVGGLGAGIAGRHLSAPVQAAPADPGFLVQAKAEKRAEPEPLDGKLLLDSVVQKELRLSQSQIDRVKAISQEVDKQADGKRTESAGINKDIATRQKQIDALQWQIVELQQKINEIHAGIETERSNKLGKAAPEILSQHAVKRLREIQRQQYGLDHMLQQREMQDMLKLNDEQIKKIEAVLKERNDRFAAMPLLTTENYLGNRAAWTYGNPGIYVPQGNGLLMARPEASYALFAYGRFDHEAHNQALRKLLNVLTDTQKQILRDWIGEPYQQNSWQVLREKK
jgi:RNA polymerase sigma factor (sigma-70 family)